MLYSSRLFPGSQFGSQGLGRARILHRTMNYWKSSVAALRPPIAAGITEERQRGLGMGDQAGA